MFRTDCSCDYLIKHSVLVVACFPSTEMIFDVGLRRKSWFQCQYKVHWQQNSYIIPAFVPCCICRQLWIKIWKQCRILQFFSHKKVCPYFAPKMARINPVICRSVGKTKVVVPILHSVFSIDGKMNSLWCWTFFK